MSESESSSDSEDNLPLSKFAKRYCHEQDNTDDEDDTPLMKLAKRLRSRDQSDNDELSNPRIMCQVMMIIMTLNLRKSQCC